MIALQLSKESKFWLYGILLTLAISIFTLVVVKNYVEKSDNKHSLQLKDMNTELQRRATVAQTQAEALQAQTLINYQLDVQLQQDLKQQTLLMQNISQEYKKNLNELNKYKNEKLYIPLDVPVSEQSKFLSEYEYQPY